MLFQNIVLGALSLCGYVASASPLELQNGHTPTVNHLDRRNSAEVSSQLEGLRVQYSLPALAISFNDGTGLNQAHTGVRKLGDRTNVTADDAWPLGSNTKAMTATIVALLIQDGLLAWNTTLDEIFASANLTIQDAFVNVTIGELATHRSGITGTFGVDNPPLLPSQMLELYEMNATLGRAVAVSTVLLLPTLGERGSYQYSNNNYIILGFVIDVVTGEAAEDVISKRLWEPLEMQSAGWGAVSESNATSVENPWPHLLNLTTAEPYAYHPEWPVVFRDLAPYMDTAGVAHMSLADYDKWLRLHVDEDAQQAVGLEAVQLEMLHTAYHGEDDEEEAEGYTYGGWIRVVEGCPGAEDNGFCLVHTGSNTMYVTYACIDTGDRITASAMTNAPYAGGGINGTTMAAVMVLNGTITL
ncbi:uncharacterized protein HMPREF1541_02563 [Cyphellophora europaea CBS 101466]|uniref:Beta-lactamase-related domain-containing protein n=1 Tax=Cyphellophora europaea (strain CBS 101466) TaxID=1220924 RepID=W2S666_CYPE1|nr:uncharacterized protein HMPREF1541_02563 [Cyphellophora europaea CBS 101466]ETN43404.1 hypothetical protein HMPREF1541_02563 [Cyphellophora europaea CBS 101466]